MLPSLTIFISNTHDSVNLFYQPLIPEGIHYLDSVESKHCVKVLRKRSGDLIQVTDGKGLFYHARITKPDASQCAFDIEESVAEPPRNYTIHIAIAPTKNIDRVEWFVEKAVEIGIDTITFIHCEHSERSHLKIDRLQKIAIGALKQSLKSTLPFISGPVEFSEIVHHANASVKFIAFVERENPCLLKNSAEPNSDYLVLIGPEGDFSPRELSMAVENKYTKVSLGQSRLRTETAGIVACHVLHILNTP